MATTEKWKTVGGGKAKKLHDSSKKKPTGPPVADLKDPLSATPTVFEGFHLKSQPQPAAKKNESASPRAETHAKKNKPNKKLAPKSEKTSLEDAVKTLSIEELKIVVEEGKEKFEDEPMIWLRSVAGQLQKHFSVVEEVEDPLFSDKTPGYPLVSVNNEFQQYLRTVLTGLKPEIRQVFFSHCTSQLLGQLKKGEQVYGWRLLVQALSRIQPDLVVSNLDNIVLLVRPCANQPRHCLPLLWCLEHVPVYTLDSCVFTIWEKVYLPILQDRNNASKVQQHALSRLRFLLKALTEKEDHCQSLPPSLLVSLTELRYQQDSQAQTLRQQLEDVVPNAKTLFFHHPGVVQKGHIRELFTCLLPLVTATQSTILLEEFNSLSARCIQLDNDCLQCWERMYQHHLKSSVSLLKYISTLWTAYSKKIPRHRFVEVITTFERTNEHLLTQTTSHQVVEASKLCKKILEMLNSGATPEEHSRQSARSYSLFSILFIVLLVLISTAFAYDIAAHGSWRDSLTRHFCEEFGVLMVFRTISSSVWEVVSESAGWLLTTVPPLVSHWSSDAEPYFMYLVDTATSIFSSVQAALSPLFAQLSLYVPQLLTQAYDLYLVVMTGLVGAFSTLSTTFWESFNPVFDWVQKTVAGSN